MRTIKFRGKRLDNSEWVYGDFEYNRKKAVARIHTYDEDGDYESQYVVDNTTVGQYTGLKDMNGKEIYEGDIIRVDCWNIHALNVQYVLGAFSAYKPDGIGCDLYKVSPDCTIIGNIHDNPELLKGGEE